MLWGGFVIFEDQLLCSWLPQLEQQLGNALAQLSGGVPRAPVGPEQGRAGAAVGLGLSSSVTTEQCQCRWTPLCSSSEPQSVVTEGIAPFLREDGAVAALVPRAPTPGPLLTNRAVGICSGLQECGTGSLESREASAGRL